MAEDSVIKESLTTAAPGVGALVMKSENEECLQALGGFIGDVLKHQVDWLTQYRYLSDASHQTVSSKPGFINEEAGMHRVARRDAPCVLLWVRKANQQVFRENGLAYCHAVPKKSMRKLNLDLTIETGSEFIPCEGAQGQPMVMLGWRAKVRSAKLVSKGTLRALLSSKGILADLNPNKVEQYVLFEFGDVAECGVTDVTEVHRAKRSGSLYMAVSCTWGDIVP